MFSKSGDIAGKVHGWKEVAALMETSLIELYIWGDICNEIIPETL
jgi:hypothetical protein